MNNFSRTNMLTDDFPFLLSKHIDGHLTARLRSLADDLDRVRAGSAPSFADLAQAPMIADWCTVLTPAGLRLAGSVTGHPHLGNRAAITTQLWAADSQERWVRTLSRFYHLAPALGTRAWS
jgi:hypothetical protein